MATQENLDRVQQLYVAYYGRPADQEGQEYWADRIEAEGEGAIINAFGNSAEYTERFGDQSNADAVNNLYNQMFGREAEPNGLAYWTGVLNSGEKTLAEIATTILNAATGEDRFVLNAKVAAAAEYTAEFGAAEDYDLEAAIAVVTDADGGVYVPTLTDAIDSLNAARTDLSDFLASEAVDFDEDPDTDTSAQDVRDNLDDAETALQTDVTDNGSTNQLNATLQDAEADLAEAEEAIADGPAGLRKEIADYRAAELALETATEAADVAAAQQSGEENTFATLNGGTLTVNADGTADIDGNDFIILNADDELEIDQDVVDAEELQGAEALLTDIQANLDAQEALVDAQEFRNEELQKVFDLEDSAVTVVDATEPSTAETPLTQALLDAEDAVETAQEAVDARAELQADVDAAQELVDQLDELEGNIEDAEEAFADLDVDLNDANTADTEDDLYIFDAETGLTTDDADTFSFEGADLFFIGDAFSRVDLEESDDLEAAAFGESGSLEVFFQDDGAGNVSLFFESEAFQGNSEAAFEGNTITLTGVAAEDLQLDNGYISIA